MLKGPNKDVSPSSGDRRLAQSAQMYHYQHQKNQIIAMENQNSGEQNGSLSDIETDEENEEGDYTVYECPGLAPVCKSHTDCLFKFYFWLPRIEFMYINKLKFSISFRVNAQTGDMEVKNPLFLDDPTPVKKNTAAAAAAGKQQPQTQQQSKTQQSNDDAKTSHQSTKK